MPKRKGIHPNPKAESARARKADQKVAQSLADEKAKLDAYWEDDDKSSQRKMQRKAEKESRRLEEIERRAELKKLEAVESEMLSSDVKPKGKPCYLPQPKITQAEIQLKLTSTTSPAHKPPVAMVTELPLKENINHTFNRLTPDSTDARSVDEAILLLKHTPSPLVSIERRSQTAFSKFEKDNLTRIRDSNPTYRMSQVKQLLKKEWMRSPENPSNQLGACKL